MTNTFSPPRSTAPQVANRKPSAVRDFTLGARLSVGGSRVSWWRFISITIGVGLGVTLLILAASVPNLLQTRNAKAASLEPRWDGQWAVSIAPAFADFRTDNIRGQLVGVLPATTSPPLPPGLDRFPAPGEFFASPALKDLLEQPDSAVLRERFPYPVAGLIGEAGLAAPNDLRFYLGTEGDLQNARSGWQGMSFGGYYDVRVWATIIGFGIMLTLPILVFISVASRIGGRQRDGMVKALRLFGASKRQIRRVVAGETLPPVVAGLMLAAGLFLAVRGLAEHITIFNYQVFGADLAPNAFAVIALAVGIPGLALWVSWLAASTLTKSIDQPTSARPQRRRKLLWRIGLAVLGLATCVTAEYLDGPSYQYETTWANWFVAQAIWSIGALIFIASVPLLLPVFMDALLRRLPLGGPASTLAVRSVQADSRTISRIIGGLAALIAATISFQTSLNASLQPASDLTGTTVVVDSWYGSTLTAADVSLINEIPKAVQGSRIQSIDAVVNAALADSPLIVSLRLSDCESIRLSTGVSSCDNDQVFVGNSLPLNAEDGSVRLKVDLVSGIGADGSAITTEQELGIPRSAIAEILGSDILMTLSTYQHMSGAPADLTKFNDVNWTFDISQAGPDALDRIKNELEVTIGGVAVYTPGNSNLRSHSELNQEGFRLALTIGALIAFIFAAFTLGLHMAENVRNRRRPLALMVAGGVPPSVLAKSQLIAATIPMALALAIGLVFGLALALLVGWAPNGLSSVDWTSIGIYLAAAAVLTLLAGLSGITAVRRAARPDALQTA